MLCWTLLTFLFQYLLKHLRTTGISAFGMDSTGPSEILPTLKFHYVLLTLECHAQLAKHLERH